MNKTTTTNIHEFSTLVILHVWEFAFWKKKTEVEKWEMEEEEEKKVDFSRKYCAQKKFKRFIKELKKGLKLSQRGVRFLRTEAEIVILDV